MSQDVHARIARQALAIAGGAERLARYLQSSPSEVEAWVKGDDIPRAPVFFALLDIVNQRRTPAGGDI